MDQKPVKDASPSLDLASATCPQCCKPLPSGCQVCSACVFAAFDDAISEEGFFIPGYTGLILISQGGMGTVYRAQQQQPERNVAIKVLHSHLADDPEMRLRFQIEAKAMASLQHGAILPVYEAGESDGLPFFSMQYVSGGTLAQRLKNGVMPAREAAQLICGIARAIHYAHQRGVLHRDLKPENILFDMEGHAYLSDFGLAKFTDASGLGNGLTRTQSFLGTPHFMAPEVATGQVAAAGTPADIYGLGALLYMCLSGQRPFAAYENLGSLLQAIAHEPLPPLTQAEAPRDLSIICARAMDKSPGGRYATASDLADELERWLNGRPILARPVSRPEALLRWARREPLSAGLAAALCGLMLAGGLVLMQNYFERGRLLKLANQRLQTALIEQARSERLLALPGYRQRGMSLLHQAREIGAHESLRQEAAAMLIQPDLTDVSSAKAATPPPSPNLSWPPPLDGSEVATQSVELRDAKTGNSWSAAKYDFSGRVAIWESSQNRPGVIFTPTAGQQVLLVTNGARSELVVANTESGVLLYQGPGTQPRSLSSVGSVATGLAISPDGNSLALGTVEGLRVISMSDGKELSSLSDQIVRCPPVWLVDGSGLAAAVGERREVTLYQPFLPKSSRTIAVPVWPQQLACDPTSTLLAIRGEENQVSLASLQSGVVWSTVTRQEPPSSAQDMISFTSTGQLLYGDAGWKIEFPCGFKVWSTPLALPSREVNTEDTAFSLRLSPNGKRLLSTSSHGLRLWETATGKGLAAHPVDNQTLDAPTQAWWLNDQMLLVQVPGGLERVPLNDLGSPQPAIPVRRLPGTRILDVEEDGTWMVELIQDDETRLYERWPQGDAEKATPAIAQHSDSPVTAVSPSGNTLRWKDLVLTPPTGHSVRAYLTAGDHLYALTAQHRILEWNGAQLSERLAQEGF